jgi:salicylate 5-hydroxylase large subunit
VFDGRKLKLLGYNRQRIPGNWKLMQENIKDPYHPGLLHTWFVTFGCGAPTTGRSSRWTTLPPCRHDLDRGQAGKGHRGHVGRVELQASMQLNDARFLDVVHEPWWGTPTAVMTTLFPSLIIQQQVNSCRRGTSSPAAWTRSTSCGRTSASTRTARDDARRLRQANLFGPAGFVSADDGEVIEFSQEGFEQKPFPPHARRAGRAGLRRQPTTW